MRNKSILNMTLTAILLAMGVILHGVVPGIFFGMKPDFILTFMFIAYLLRPTLVQAITIGIAGGFLSGITTQFPGGFLPNLIDKPITMISIFVVLTILRRLNTKILTSLIIGLVGTLISGTVFLGVASVLIGLPPGASFTGLMIAVVLPTTLINGISTMFLYRIFIMVGNQTRSVYIEEVYK